MLYINPMIFKPPSSTSSSSTSSSLNSFYSGSSPTFSLNSLGMPELYSPIQMESMSEIVARPGLRSTVPVEDIHPSLAAKNAFDSQRAGFTGNRRILSTPLEAIKQLNNSVNKLEKLGIPSEVATAAILNQPALGLKPTQISTIQNIKNSIGLKNIKGSISSKYNQLKDVFQKVTETGRYKDHVDTLKASNTQRLLNAGVPPATIANINKSADKYRPGTYTRLKTALGFKKGGRVKKSGKYLVHKKEFVVKKGSKISKTQQKKVTKRKK